tara:strand:+ start:56138 stop:58495 length:2358 start_codon:yes stop_codon:yes gene_type:complete
MPHLYSTQFEQMINHAPGHIFWYDLENVLLGCNAQQAKYWGYDSPAHVIGKSLYDLFDSDRADVLAANNRKVVENGEELTIEETRVRDDGSKVTFLSKKSPLRDDDGSVIGIVGSAFDVSERTRERERAEKAERMLESLLQLMPGHIFWKDTEGRMVECNEQQARSAGMTREEIIGKSDYDFQTQEEADFIRQVDQDIIDNNKHLTVEEPGTYQGERIEFLSRKAPWFDAKGKVLGIIGMAVDITAQKQTEAALKEAKEKAEQTQAELTVLLAKQQQLEQELRISKSQAESTLQSVMAILPGVVYWKDRNGVFMGANDMQAEMADLQHGEQIIGKTSFDLPWKENAAAITKIEQSVMDSGESLVTEEVISAPGHEDRIYLSHKTPLRGPNGEVVGVLGISLNITDRKHAEVALKQAKEAAEAAAVAKSEFIGNMSHDFRTPLNGIMGVAQILASEELDHGHKELVDGLMDCGYKLLQLVEDVMDFSRLDLGKMTLKVEMLDLRRVVETAVSNLAHQVREKDLRLLILYPSDVPRLVKSDSYCVTRILLNLLSNAIKFTHDGHIVIKVSQLNRMGRVATLRMSIIDTGMGISGDKHDEIFQQFRRLEPTYKSTTAGHGLGLAAVKILVERLGGQIQVHSDNNEGSTFEVDIPFLLQEDKPTMSSWEEHCAKLETLVISDDKLTAETWAQQLAVNEVTSSSEAIKCMAEQAYDIILLDDETEIDTLTLVHDMVAMLPHKPFIALCSEPLDLSQVNVLQDAGVDCYFTKPLEPSELLESLPQVWKQSR